MTALSPRSAGENVADLPWPAMENVEEQRAYPRIDLNIAVAFRNANGEHSKGQATNISPDGLQVRCNLSAAQMLHPAGGRICPSNAPIVQLSMELPVQNAKKRLVIGGQLLYAGTCDAEPRCVIGLRFLEKRPLAQKLLDQFFAEKMQIFYEEDLKRAAR